MVDEDAWPPPYRRRFLQRSWPDDSVGVRPLSSGGMLLVVNIVEYPWNLCPKTGGRLNGGRFCRNRKESSLWNRNTHIIKKELIKKEHSYYEIGTHPKGTLVLSKGTLLLLNRNSSKRNTHIIKKELIKKGTLVLSKGTLILLNRNSSKKEHSYYEIGTHPKGTPPKGTLPPAQVGHLIYNKVLESRKWSVGHVGHDLSKGRP